MERYEEILNTYTPQFPQEIVGMGERGGSENSDNWMRGYSQRNMDEIDTRIEELVNKAQALAGYYITQRKIKKGEKKGTQDDKFDRLQFGVSDRRDKGKGVRLRWASNAPTHKRTKDSKIQTLWKDPVKGSFQVSLKWLDC